MKIHLAYQAGHAVTIEHHHYTVVDIEKLKTNLGLPHNVPVIRFTLLELDQYIHKYSDDKTDVFSVVGAMVRHLENQGVDVLVEIECPKQEFSTGGISWTVDMSHPIWDMSFSEIRHKTGYDITGFLGHTMGLYINMGRPLNEISDFTDIILLYPDKIQSLNDRIALAASIL